METLFREALAHQNAGRLEEAEQLYRRVVGWRPDWVLGNLGILLRKQGRLAEAEEVLRQALAANPESLAARHALGMTLLQLGRYAEGWPLYEARHQMYSRPTAPLPEWRGESLAGKRMVVVSEQGFGDQILLARFLPLLAERAAEVSLYVSPVLRRLFSQLPVRIETAAGWDGVEGDVWASIGSIPRWLEAGPDDAPAPYLAAAPDPAAGGVGLMLSGGAGNPNPQRIPDARAARAIRGLASFVDLDPAVSGARDFAETAGIIQGLDLVVSVDTSVAHLAGALGKPCVVLMPRPATDWYAGWDDDRSPWYPGMRLIRQRSPGDWAGVISALATRLKDTSGCQGSGC